jgi:neutral ceramidase
MNHPVRHLAKTFLLLCLFCAAPAFATISAGISVVDITPPLGGQTVGYGTGKPTDGINYPITARVLLLESGGKVTALVVWDLCVSTSPWLQAQMADLGIERLLLFNTHTHAGPDLDQPDFPAKENPLRGTTERKVLEGIKDAKQRMFPAFFAASEGSIQLGYNRLVRQPEGYAITHFDNPERIPYGPVDPTVGVLRITDADGAVRAVLVNYACHSVVLGPANQKLSADYPGAMRQEVEASVGKGAVCFFLQGAAGEINPLMLARSGDVAKDLPVVDEMGKALAREVVAVLGRMPTAGKSEQLATMSKTLTVENRWDAKKTQSVSVGTLLLNSDIAILAMPGEPFVQYQLDWRRKAGVPHAFFFGYCSQSTDPWTGYMPDLESAARGGYGASDGTHVAVGTGERLLHEGLAQLYTLQGRLRSAPQRHLNQ